MTSDAVAIMRRRCYGFYWKMRDRIVPGLEYSQAIYERVLDDALRTRTRWLDVGCGHQVLPSWRGEAESGLVARTSRAVGVDYDHDSLRHHRTLHHRVRADIATLPFRDASFDLVTANMVLEHLKDPQGQLNEIFRVLEPGGVFLAHTVNVRGYLTIAAKLLPESLKPSLVWWLERRRPADLFPTHYRINSEALLYKYGHLSGFSDISVRYILSDAQMVMVPPLAVAELFAIRLLMKRRFRRLRTNLIALMTKPGP